MEIYHPKDEELLREMRRVRRSDRRKRATLGMVIVLIVSIAAGLFLFLRYYQLAVAHGASMGATLPEGSLVLVRKPEAGKEYEPGDIILYEKRIASPVEITILSPKGKIRDYCSYILYREVGTVKQYYSSAEGYASWQATPDRADEFVSSAEGTVRMETENLKNGEYWLKEVKASYGQDVLKDPISFMVSNPVRTQIRRVIGVSGDSVTLGGTETRVNGQPISTLHTSGRTADAAAEGRRVIVPKGAYFVQGDQLSLSLDSREAEYGTVSDEEIIGRAEFALWPLRCFGSLTGTKTTASEGGLEETE